jgi:hypothetical protein
MLHTLSPLAGGSPHNGLQIILFVPHFIFCNRLPTARRGRFYHYIPIDIYFKNSMQ